MAKPRSSGVSRDRLLEMLTYNPQTGVFRWRQRPGIRSRIMPGDIAGSIYKNGYRYVALDGTDHRAHRLAWLYVYGDPIPDEIDHINLDKSDNRLANLRASTTSQNQANRSLPKNNTSGIKGVRWEASRQKWISVIEIRGVKKYLGRFKTKEEAAAAYATAAETAFRAFARTT